MIYNSHIRKLFANYHSGVVLEFIKELPLPDTTKNRFYRITTEDDRKMVVWGKNNRVLLTQFDDFLQLLIFH
jgi:hypothetical protein